MLNRPHRSRGFTLVELMIGLVILGILLAAAMPSFRAWVQNTQIRNAADAMVNGLQLARAQAISRNTLVRFQLTAGALGWEVADVATGAAIQAWSGRQGAENTVANAVPAGATTVTYSGLGRVVANADGTASITSVDVTAGTGVGTSTRPLRVNVGLAGGSRMCDPAVVTAGDPRGC